VRGVERGIGGIHACGLGLRVGKGIHLLG